jgi:hypothetical protein
MTMELGYDFSLDQRFRWDEPISEMQQQSITTYGCDEDRLALAQHFSVSRKSLEELSIVGSDLVRLAVANNAATMPEALTRLSHDSVREVRIPALQRVNELPVNVRMAARAASETRFQRIKSRLTA